MRDNASVQEDKIIQEGNGAASVPHEAFRALYIPHTAATEWAFSDMEVYTSTLSNAFSVSALCRCLSYSKRYPVTAKMALDALSPHGKCWGAVCV